MSDKPKVKPTEPNSQETVPAPSGFFNWPKIIAVAIPAYAYFLGYSSFKYRLEHIGFDSPNVSAAAGEVYYQAMHAFAFITGKVLPAMPEILKQSFEASIPTMAASIFLGIGAYWLQRRVAKSRKNQKSKTKKKDNSRRSHFINSLGVAAATNGIALLSVPAILALIILLAFIILPPPILGMYMGADDLREFKCPETFESGELPGRCSLLHLTDGDTLVGQIFHRDDRFTYVLTSKAALSIPSVNIETRERFVTTGKINETVEK